ncbi:MULTISPECIES: phosphonate C-P lyase system protein PhnG [Gordonia]|uniref:Lyase n=1 Tax=Gordonia alkanivorans CGMCC 6845 TaxID=1423140 RepID=W9DJK1_9ACTN|nr:MULTISPECIES: phosphonate C-P lyase system protein PhnG [Gordonia]ETA06605.1 lyase [Gordonia alkanivorans CGMCC 6845]MDH3008067.1 phosphonate C-P lyase system protein PhnG [Gordonia alkanivorans]MDH3011712.1 phosphonate C-P lyase system protein PhnG [Gordonia alkanivorans]MDH3016874.1 phosphonate C-P lyase system protein PhnG [Gordonia alkanivorans]MDH3020932.1 phosphonate C-P lyase system protein PhnG [Gordonia alkanivorans]
MTATTDRNAADAADPAVTARQNWMRTLASSPAEAVEAAWHQWEPKPAVQEIRSPETGLVMLRARIDSVGDRFNVGEATVTRATVRLHGAPLSADAVGSAYILGTNRDHAHAAACFDALLCDDTERARVLAEVVEPMRKAADDLDTARRAEARSTLVDFFNVSREHE